MRFRPTLSSVRVRVAFAETQARELPEFSTGMDAPITRRCLRLAGATVAAALPCFCRLAVAGMEDGGSDTGSGGAFQLRTVVCASPQGWDW